MWRRLSAIPFLFYMVEERAVGTVNPFHHILNGLTAKSLPLRVKRFLDFCDMDFQLIGRKMLSVQPVIPSVHGNTKIIESGCVSGPDNYCLDMRLRNKPEQMVIEVNKNGVECVYDVKLDI